MHPFARERLFRELDSIAELRGAGVAYEGDGRCEVLRPAGHVTGFETWVVVREVDPLPRSKTEPGGAPARNGRRSALAPALWSCTDAVISGVAVGAGAAAAPLSMGGSLALVYLGAAGAVASAAQCGISLGRLIGATLDPDSPAAGSEAAWLDNADRVLDAIGMVSALATVHKAIRWNRAWREAAGRPLKELLGRMSRAERKRLAQEVARATGSASTRRQFIRAVRAGKLPKIFSQRQIDAFLVGLIADAVSDSMSFESGAEFVVDVLQER